MPAGNGHFPRIFYRALEDNVNKYLSFNVENDDIWMKNRILRNYQAQQHQPCLDFNYLEDL